MFLSCALSVHIHIVQHIYSSGRCQMKSGYFTMKPPHLNPVYICLLSSVSTHTNTQCLTQDRKTQILFKSLGCKQIIRVVRERLRVAVRSLQKPHTHDTKHTCVF